MCLCELSPNPPVGSEERVQTRRYAVGIRTKTNMSPLPFGLGGHDLALIDPVVSEMFEKCGRRQRRACLYDTLTNQYIKRSARIIRSHICCIKMTYTFEDAVPKEDNQIERDFPGPDQSLKQDFEMRFCSETVFL